MKSTPPSLNGEKRLTRGYPAITATVVNLRQPVVTYANWFSYVTADFLSQNREIERALRMSRALFPREKLRFVGDSGLDDQKIFAQVERQSAEFIFRAAHNRRVEVFNPRLPRWESELLFDLVASVPFEFEQDVIFTHARAERRVHLHFGWFEIRLPETQQALWVLVAHDAQRQHDLVLLTNIPLLGLGLSVKSTATGASAAASNMAIASIKKKVWMWKICGSRRWNACAVSLSWSCWRRSLSVPLGALGRQPP